MRAKFPENLTTIEVQLADEVDFFLSSDNDSAGALEEIQEALKKARQYFHDKKYEKAIRHYKRARALIYKLIFPKYRISRRLFQKSGQLPLTTLEMERKWAEIGLELLAEVQPNIRFRKPPVLVDELADFEESDLGFHFSDIPDTRIDEQITYGTELIAKGRASESARVFKEVLSHMQGKEDPERRSIAQLNYSTALIARGRFEQALRQSEAAAKSFAKHDDKLGQAQALHNAGLALKKQDQARLAAKKFTEARSLYKSAIQSDNRSSSSAPSRIVASNKSFRTAQIGTLKLSSNIPSDLHPSSNVSKLFFLGNAEEERVSMRWLGEDVSWTASSVDHLKTTPSKRQRWQYGIRTGSQIAVFKWAGANQPKPSDLIARIYRPRLEAEGLPQLRLILSNRIDSGLYLDHTYSFVIPWALGNCFHALGEYARAESYYLQAAKYRYLNPRFEGTRLWVKIAENILEWGDTHYREEQIEAATEIYCKLMNEDLEIIDDAPLFSIDNLKRPAARAREVIAGLRVGEFRENNPAISRVIYWVAQRWQYLNAGLDFFGLSMSPIFTFDYLQQTARHFAHQAIQAEREYIDFTVRAEAESATRRELESAVARSEADAQVQQMQWLATAAERDALGQAVDLAELRARNAREDQNAYESAGRWQYITQSLTTAAASGQDWWDGEIRELARDIERGAAEGKHGKVAAAATLLGGQKSYEYQLARLTNQIEELDAAVGVAEAQFDAAEARTLAAQYAAAAATAQRDLLKDSLTAFDDETFTPEVWYRMATYMRNIANSYQNLAIRIAKLMERAFNFEQDAEINLIKNYYNTSLENNLLGSDLLLKDIDSFTYYYTTQKQQKASKIKDVISLRNDYPFDFYTFQQSGKISIDTSLHEFDRRHPGFYQQRIEAVAVEVIGLLPADGVNGMLRGSFLSRYRTAEGEEKQRFHAADTLALSEYRTQRDIFRFRADSHQLGLFEGQGIGGHWQLELPKRSNNFDFRLIADVQLIFYYTAQYNPILKNKILERPSLPGELIHVRDLALRHDFPEVWFQLLRNSEATFSILPFHLPRNETNFQIIDLAVKCITAKSLTAEGIRLELLLPNGTTVDMTTDATGLAEIETTALSSPQRLLGDWRIRLFLREDSPLRREDGSINPRALLSIGLITQYQFDWR